MMDILGCSCTLPDLWHLFCPLCPILLRVAARDKLFLQYGPLLIDPFYVSIHEGQKHVGWMHRGAIQIKSMLILTKLREFLFPSLTVDMLCLPDKLHLVLKRKRKREELQNSFQIYLLFRSWT